MYSRKVKPTIGGTVFQILLILKAIIRPADYLPLKDPERKKLGQSGVRHPVSSVNSALDQADIPLGKKSRKAFQHQHEDSHHYPLKTLEGLIRSAAYEKKIEKTINEHIQNLHNEAQELERHGLLTPEKTERYKTNIESHYAGGLLHSIFHAAKLANSPIPTASANPFGHETELVESLHKVSRRHISFTKRKK